MKRKCYQLANLALLLVCASVLASCMMGQTHRNSTSVVNFLYPDESGHIDKPGIPSLSLPLKVGIAFVPDNYRVNNHLTESDKMDLMKRVSEHFKQYDYVKSIELIPSAYLRKNGSFANLDQIQTMYGIDVMALISYDQTRFTDEGLASITYWTLVGAYIVPGEKNDTHTMVDTTVYDIRSRKMLFRAPGISYIKSTATPVNLSEQLRKDSLKGFTDASEDLIVNLDIQLQLFKERVKESPDEFKVNYKQGYSGGGSVDLALLLSLGLLLLSWICLRCRAKK